MRRPVCLLCLIVMVPLILAGCLNSRPSLGGGGGGGTFAPVPTSHDIVFLLTGTAKSADLTLTMGAGGQSQQQAVSIPLTNTANDPGLSFTANDGEFLYLSAQNNGIGDMTCEITEDGVSVATNTSSGEYAIVTCDGTA